MKENYIGKIVKDRYRIVREFSSGDDEYSFLCEDILAGKKVAMRLIPYSYRDADLMKEAETIFKNQMDVLCRLEHPGLPQILEGFAEKLEMYIITEYNEGETLEEKIGKKKEMAQEEIFSISEEVLKILDYLHSRYPPVIFRDLKPSNIFLRRDGRVQLVNFALARTYKPFKSQDTIVRCSKGYAAPEQYGGKGQTDARVDIYAFGVTLHRLLTGHEPSRTPFKLPPLNSFQETLWPWWQDIISKATELKVENRYKSARDLLNDMKKMKDGHRGNGAVMVQEAAPPEAAVLPPQEHPGTGPSAEGGMKEGPADTKLIVLKLAGFFGLFLCMVLFIIGVFRFALPAVICIILCAVVFMVAGYFFFFRKL